MSKVGLVEAVKGAQPWQEAVEPVRAALLPALMKAPAEPHRRRMVRLVVGSWRYPCRSRLCTG